MKNSTLKLESPWPEVKQLILEVEPSISEEDLEYEIGKENEMLEKLAVIMNRSPEHIKAWIESLSANQGKAS